MIQHTIRLDTSLEARDTNAGKGSFPFDSKMACLRVELSHFKATTEGEIRDIRFDIYKG